MRIEAESQVARDVIADMADLVVRHGGYLHPSMSVFERSGQLSIHVDGPHTHALGDKLIQIPNKLNIPINGLIFGVDEDCLLIKEGADSLSNVQRTLIENQISLYNDARKIPWARSNLLTNNLHSLPLICAALKEIRPNYGLKHYSEAELFIKTRQLVIGPVAPRMIGEKIIMPIIDFMNHHPNGAPFDIDDSDTAVGISCHGHENEAFARYFVRVDALNSALHYGYAELRADMAISAPVVIQTNRLGTILVEGDTRKHFESPLDLPSIAVENGQLNLSHYSCDLRNPAQSIASLTLPLTAWAKRCGLEGARAKDAVRQAITALRDANILKLDTLLEAVRKTSSDIAAANTLAQAASRQAEIFRTVFAED